MDAPPNVSASNSEAIENEDVPMIAASHLSGKFRALANYSPENLSSEIKRLASLSYHALKRELEPKDHIQTLPVELLAEIFTIGQAFELEAEATPVSHLISGAVCRKWRTIVLGTPPLWRWITVDDRDPWDRTRAYLERAAQCPLHIHMPWVEEEDADEASIRTVVDLNNAMDLLIPHVHHWRTFQLDASQYTLIYHALLRMEHLSAPNLEELSLSHQDDAEVGETFEPEALSHRFKLFSGGDEVPKSLKTAYLWGVHLDWATDLFTQLTSLTLAYHSNDVRPTVDQFFAIITSSAPTLKEFTLEYSGPEGEEGTDAWPTEPIPFLALRYLKLAFLPASYIQNLLRVIEAPELDQLDLDFDGTEDEGTMADLARVIEIMCTGGIQQSSAPGSSTRKQGSPLFPVLHSLKLLAYPGDIIDLGILLYHYPGLTDLTINFHWIPRDFIHFLSAPIREFLPGLEFELPRWVSQQFKDSISLSSEETDKAWLLPNLQVFRAYKQNGSSLRYLTEQRKTAGIPLREIHYSDGSVINVRDRVWLADNLEKLEEFEESDDEEEDSDIEDEEEDSEIEDDNDDGDDDDDEP